MGEWRKDRIYQDRKTGEWRILRNARKVGPHLVGDSGAAVMEDVIPERRHAIASTPRQRPRVFQQKKHLVYLRVRGYIFYAVTTGRPSSGTVKYQKLWPVLKDSYGGDLTGLVDRIITRDTTADDRADLKAYFVQAESFFILGNRAWWADRFNLYSGVLSGGKNFRGTSAVVANVPKDHNPSGDYNHIFRCFVRKLTGGSYEMLTEERRTRLGSLGSNYWNWRAVINKYTSADLKTWAFSETLKEDDRLEYIDYDHHLGATGLSLPPYSNLPRELSHIKYTGTEQVTRLGYYLIFIEGGIEIRQKGNKQRAWLNYGGVNYTFVSTDGIYWRYESFGTVYEKDGSTVGSGFAYIVTPPVL